jgi:DNA polymerase zeta
VLFSQLTPAKSRHQLLPDPEKDELTAVFFCYQNEDESLEDTTIHANYHAGLVVVDSPQLRGGRIGLEGIPVHLVDSELDLINWMIDTVKAWDPDVLAGWELHNSSWGYLSARAHEAFSACSAQTLADHRRRLDGAVVTSRLGSFGAEEGFLLGYSLVHL